MGKGIFLYEDGFIANLIHNAPENLPPVSEASIPACIPTASCTSSPLASSQGSSGKSWLREIFEQHKDDILAGRWDLIPEFFLFMNSARCEKLREMLDAIVVWSSSPVRPAAGRPPSRATSRCRSTALGTGYPST